MKKQILILVLFVLASFAGINKSLGQVCTPSATSPAIGDTYHYVAAISGGSFTGTGTYLWYVLAEADAGDLINGTPITSGTEFTSTLANADDITIVWNTPALGNTYYLVLKYSETISGCDVENIKAWEITPINKFLLAINSFSGLGENGSYCPPAVSSASISGGKATYNYGTNTMYAEITASNFAGDWTPSFRITGLSGDQAIQNVVWGTTAAGAASTTTDDGGGVYTATSDATAAYDGSLKIYLKFDIVNNTFENTGGSTISIAVDGVIAGTTTKDVVSDTDCTAESDFGKTHDQTIKPRPTVTGTPAVIPEVHN